MPGQGKTSVLFFIPSLKGGGAERVITTLLRHINRDRFDVSLVVLDMTGAVYRDDLPSDIEIIDLACPRVSRALLQIMSLVWSRRPDVLFSTLSHLNLTLALMRPLLPRATRMMARETGILSLALADGSKEKLWRWVYRKFYCKHDLIICQSQYMRTDLIENFALAPEKTLVIHNPVDIDRIRALAVEPVDWPGRCNPHKRLVAAGRLVHVKGFDILIEAIGLLQDPDVQLAILGDGPLKAELQTLVNHRGLVERIHFVGYQTNPYAWFAQADALILSSRHEGFPNVVLEALACGTPVIATPAPGGLSDISTLLPGAIKISAEIGPRELAQEIKVFLEKGSRSSYDEVIKKMNYSAIASLFKSIE